MSENETTVAVNLTSSTNEKPSGNGSKPAQNEDRHGPIPPRESDSVIRAKEILRGGDDNPRELLKIAKALKNEMRFGYARRLLARASNHKALASDHPLREVIFQQLALCTYKDQDLPADKRLDRALEILRTIADFSTTKTSETLGLIAAIYKRKWEIDNQRRNLELSLSYYRRGYEEGVDKDQGYTGINAAFVLDRLASIEELEAKEAGRTSDVAKAHREEARKIRATLVEQVRALTEIDEHKWLENQWFYYATLAEAAFGLQDYKKAVEWIREGQEKAKPVNEWELETCARQLASLARLQSTEDLSEPWKALKDAFGDDAVPRNAFVGKIGLALSGGGFRASLYHLGVLARLAELDVLRNVEVLSCVSGGAIVGAYYYLKVRHLLHTKTNSEITREDYIKVVHDMIDEFTAGVRKNIRTRVAVNPLKNFRMFWSEDYSRTARAAELYERHLYSQVKDGQEDGERWLNELTIAPLIMDQSGKRERDYSFVPKYHNWRRDAKVPILVLNAATMNTGHTWQFTASWMGEAPGGIDTEIDGNERLRRMYYPDAPGKHKRIRLGHAVGASAAVPGVFEPLTMDLLYPERIVRLADGGVCDNQGLATLFEQDCKVILVSDASGQMESQPASSRGVLGVLLRTNDIFQARIREAQYTHLKGQHRSSLLRGFMFVHLKGDLDVDPVDWLECLDKYDASDDARPSSRRGPLTKYGIAKDIQRHLSALRTDLDSFSEAEAYALMTSGYCMTEHQLRMEHRLEGFVEPSKVEDWKFLEIKPYMKGEGDGYKYLKQLLSAGSSLAFKVWQFDPLLKWVARVSFILIIAAIFAALYFWWNSPLPDSVVQRGTGFLDTIAINLKTLTPQKAVTWLFWLIGGSVVMYLLARVLTWLFGVFAAKNVMLLVRWKDTMRRIAIATFVSTFGCAAAFIHLYIFDRRFLSLSTLEKIKQKNG
jgi:Predicted esterase of the alpha-beta hydrolase superfamily